MPNVEPIVWAFAAAFAVSLGIGLFLVFPEKDRLDRWLGNVREMQRRRLEQSALESTKPDSLAARLQRAGINVYPWVFHLFCATCAIAVAFAVGAYTKNPVAGAIMSIFGYRFPLFVLGLINRTYDRKMDMQIELLIGGTAQAILSSGSMQKALENLVRVIDDPLRSELNKILSAYRLGRPLERGFVELAYKTGHTELVAYSRIVSMAQTHGTEAAADAFRRLYKLVEQLNSLERERKSALAEYTMFVLGVVFGLPLVYFIATSSSDLVYESMVNWFPGKVATVVIAVMVVASYLGYKFTTRSVKM